MKLLDHLFDKLSRVLYPEADPASGTVAVAIASSTDTEPIPRLENKVKEVAGSDNTYRTDMKDETPQWWNHPGHADAALTNDSPCEQISSHAIIETIDLQLANGTPPVFTIPSNVLETLKLLEKKDFEYSEVAAVIEKSPALTGIFLSYINSSFYNRGYAITELRTALSRLGKNNIRSLLQLYSVKVSFSNDELFGGVAQKIISHSYAVAVVAAYLSQRYYPEPGLAFLAGLLHDVGKLGILKTISMTPEFIIALKNDLNERMFDQIFAARHEQVGALLGHSWNMDHMSLAAIERHHRVWDYSFEESDQLDYNLCMLVNLSNKIARMLGYGLPIEAVNVFLESSALELNLEKNAGAVDFLKPIPEIVSMKVASNFN